VDPEKLMRLVGNTSGAQFTPAGVLRLPLEGLEGATEILGRLRERFEELVM
jgi:transcription-repair coupling factor (superfamily II helicase)